MIFRELKAGYTVHFVTKNPPLRYGTGKVINVGLPQIDRQSMNATQMVVDVTVEMEGKTRTYTVPESHGTAYAPDMIVSIDKDAIVRELEAMRTQADDALAKTEYYKQVREQASEIMSDLNPAEKEKRKTEERMSKIESNMESISSMVSELLKKCNNHL